MKKKLGLAAGVAVTGGVLLAMGINSVDSQPKFVEPTQVSTTSTTSPKPTRSKTPEISKTTEKAEATQTPTPRKTRTIKPSPTTKAPVDLGAEPTVKTDYANCTELRKDFPKGVPSNHPAYEKKFDRDNDGFGCEVD